uniref:Uncharacterized protein n=1 Tax=Oryza sativa subsp. indica TaxID=39946 RepID=A0A1B4Z173_ORYSI|nr:hypothetical protein [Oryza sativa Indica Group]BAV53212.1 hypothetical protein [Oryza sativa Indica Group]
MMLASLRSSSLKEIVLLQFYIKIVSRFFSFKLRNLGSRHTRQHWSNIGLPRLGHSLLGPLYSFCLLVLHRDFLLLRRISHLRK